MEVALLRLLASKHPQIVLEHELLRCHLVAHVPLLESVFGRLPRRRVDQLLLESLIAVGLGMVPRDGNPFIRAVSGGRLLVLRELLGRSREESLETLLAGLRPSQLAGRRV